MAVVPICRWDMQREDRYKMTKRDNRDNRKPAMAVAREQTQCRFCRSSIEYVDYKDVEMLQKLLTNRGKIYSRKRSGNCAGCQRKVKKAIKRARFMALLPFTA